MSPSCLHLVTLSQNFYTALNGYGYDGFIVKGSQLKMLHFLFLWLDSMHNLHQCIVPRRIRRMLVRQDMVPMRQKSGLSFRKAQSTLMNAHLH